jgi:hypothetical protein
MSIRCLTHAALLVLAAPLVAVPAAQAQISDAIEGALGGAKSSSGGSLLEGLGGGSMPSLDQVGVGNIAGVVEYCAKNQFLGGDAAGVAGGLVGKLGGQDRASAEPGYQEGLGGILGGNSGQKVDLGSPSIKEQLTDTICKQVLKYGQSLL